MSSNRRQAFDTPERNPATKFFQWKSDNKNFQYYDKEQKDEPNKGQVVQELPFKFLVLDEMNAVSGWNDASSSGITSNEVKFIGREIMTVKPFKGNEIAKGLYKDIKEKIKAAGGHYVKSVYIMLPDGELANIQLKGSAVQAWGEFTKIGKKRLVDEWVTVDSFTNGKKGAVKFTVPEFKFSGSLSEGDSDLADEAFNILETYMKAYLAKAEPASNAEPEEDNDEPKDDLDF